MEDKRNVAVAMVLIAVQEGRVPLPSLAALSGRGAYVVWLLRGDGEGSREDRLAVAPEADLPPRRGRAERERDDGRPREHGASRGGWS